MVGAAAAAAMAIGLRDYSIGYERYMEGLHGGPGNHSSALLTLMPCILMIGWYGRRAGWHLGIQVSIWAFALLVPVSAFFTLNRTVWLGLGVQVLLIGAVLIWRHKASARAAWSTRAKLASGVLAFAIVAGTAVTLYAVQARRATAGWTALVQDTRFALWPEILEQIGERPFTGYGFGRGLLRASLMAEFKELDAFLWHAHNIFLEALLQLGIPGLALLLVLLGALLREAWRAARDASDVRAACGIALMAVVLGMVLRNMTDTLFVRQNSLLFWGVAGVLLAWSSAPAVYSGTQRRKRPRTASGPVSSGAASQASTFSTKSSTSGARACATLSLGCGVGRVFSASASGSS
jgi:O-antigen ligase